MTQKTLAKLPMNILIKVNRLKSNYDGSIETRARICGYLDCLLDCGIITAIEKRCLHSYMTL